MQETQSNVSSLLGQIVQTFGDIRVAETQAELEQLRFTDATVTRRPEDTIDETAASARNLFDLSSPIGRANAFTGGAFLVGGLLITVMVYRYLKK